MNNRLPSWPHPNPFILEHRVKSDELDFLNHVNNKVYLAWMEHIAWQHSLSVGIDYDQQKEQGKIMVVKQHELNYLAPCFLDDKLLMGTWIGERIGCCQRKRHYEIYREADGKKIFSGHTIWVCMDLHTQKACKIPDLFIDAYQQ